jgi:hypothetical protein
VENLARQLSRLTGSNLTEVIRDSLEFRMKELTAEKEKREERITAISDECGGAPDLDSRSFDEILGYDSSGTFGHDNR